ncbi:phenylacetate--CoA ligase family protein [Propionispora vibrioides]|uniref:Phenylacetate-CoA ligase n=1 Tax=Propionispora vibrioides TaxID=112903 RepID=A0A1H8S1X0_9FIRM|nr:phenylacetate--CoA ligase family protein [Propionispora vibrioides]SEO72526.1 phenylacetate-CoA ligase [Propionispora vibrioides]
MIRINPVVKFLVNPVFIKERFLLKRSEKYSQDQLQSLKMKRLQDLCIYAYENCGYYREIFNQTGFNPERLRYFDQIKCLPFLTKEIVRNNLAGLTSKKMKSSQLEYVTTGGSTGTPLGFYLQKNVTYPLTYAYEWRQYNWGRINFFDKRARIRGLVIQKGIFQKTSDTLFLSAFHLIEKNAVEYVRLLESFCPNFIEAYPSAILFLAKWIINNSLKPILPNLKAIFLSSETVSMEQKEVISQAFSGVKVFNKYGNCEQATIIGQCELGRLHEFEEYSYTEYLDDDNNPVTEGIANLVSTSFVNKATVLIRYKTDDIVELGKEKCLCGRNHRVIENIVGRTHEYLLGRDGQHITIAAINSHSDAFDEVLGFQYYQEIPGEAIIKVICEDKLSKQRKEKMMAEATFRSAGLIKFKVQQVEDLVKSPRGKSLYIVRRCKGE